MEIVRRAFEVYAEAGDIEAILDLHTEDLVIHPFDEWPDDHVYHGREGLRKLAGQWTDYFDDFGFEVRDIREAGDAVVALLEMSGRVKGADVGMATQMGSVTQVRGGLIAEIRYFSSWPATLEAAGLRE